MARLVDVKGAGARAGITRILEPATLSVNSGEVWAFLGENGSGKTVLSQIVSGRRRPAPGEVTFAAGMGPDHVRIVSFEEQLRLIERERRDDESWLMNGATDQGTTVREYVAAADRSRGADFAQPASHTFASSDDLLARFRLSHRASGGLRFLSTGELRKAILCRALVSQPQILVLDDPYDGLDVSAASELRELIPTLASDNHAVILVLGRESQLGAGVTHVAYLDDRRLVFAGGRQEFNRWRDSQRTHRPGAGSAGSVPVWTTPRAEDGAARQEPHRDTLIRMRGVELHYGEKPILAGIDWTARTGETWHIVGPNGAGKTTLLSLVSGGNPKAYGQDIELFGRRRGTGESVWDIKRKIGQVSGDFHASYPLRTPVLDAVLSGFTDSAGLYERPSGYRVEIARKWLGFIGLADREQMPLRRLSYGEQRAVLVARAMVKMPPLLIADEPCQGLDDRHSALVISILERIGRETETCVLYVSHDPALTLKTATHRLTLVPGASGSTATTVSLSSPA